jgi:hypothetical protein
MLGAVSRAFDRFRGSGGYAVTVPSMDGAFRPNETLENAPAVIEIEAPDDLASDGRRVWFSSGATLYELKTNGAATVAEPLTRFDGAIACLDVSASGAIAVGLATGGVLVRGGASDGRRFDMLEGRPLTCPTALHFSDGDTLILCLGSDRNSPVEWKRDLLDGCAGGSVWRIDLRSGRGTCIADGLAWPNGVITAEKDRIIVAESWRHQVVELRERKAIPLLAELPGYPARITTAPGGGYWLAIFAPRSQLVEFVLREPRFRGRMMREIDPEYWVAPSLHCTIDYLEPLQAGAIKQLGELKPWAPSRSYGLVVRLDAAFQPKASMHSRANGRRHGVTACLEIAGRVLAASKGGNVIVAVDAAAANKGSPG